MLAEAAGVKKIIIACGRTDLRKGIDGLAQLIGTKYDLNPFEKDVQCKRNNAIDAGIGFAVSFGFFTVLFILATLVDVFSL